MLSGPGNGICKHCRIPMATFIGSWNPSATRIGAIRVLPGSVPRGRAT